MQTLQQKTSLVKFEKIEAKMDSNFLLDSCVWIGYFTGDTPKAKEIIDSDKNNNFTSVLSIFEFMIKLKMMKLPQIIINNMVEVIEENSTIIEINTEIAKKASSNSKKYNLFAVDSLLYTTAEIEGITFVTADKHFLTTPNTILL